MTADREQTESGAPDGDSIPFLEELFRGEADPPETGRDRQGNGDRRTERASEGTGRQD